MSRVDDYHRCGVLRQKLPTRRITVSGGLFRSTFTSIKAIRYRWKSIYKKPSTSYQRSSWNCKHFFRNNPIPKWTAMKETEPEGAKGLQHIRKTIILEDL